MNHKSDRPALQATAVPVPARQVLRQFRVIFNAVKVHFRQVERESGLGGAQVWALSVVAESPGIGVGSRRRRWASISPRPATSCAGW